MVDPDAFQDVHYGYDRQTFSYKDWKDVEITLAGTYQVTNAALALEAVEALRNLGYSLTEEQVRKGMKEAFWRGRFSVIHKNPVVVIDGAHNPAAAKVLKDSLETYFQGKRPAFYFRCVCGQGLSERDQHGQRLWQNTSSPYRHRTTKEHFRQNS